jgi:hypothetical protein
MLSSHLFENAFSLFDGLSKSFFFQCVVALGFRIDLYANIIVPSRNGTRPDKSFGRRMSSALFWNSFVCFSTFGIVVFEFHFGGVLSFVGWLVGWFINKIRPVYFSTCQPKNKLLFNWIERVCLCDLKML